MPAAAERFRDREQVCVIVAPEAVKIEAVSKVSTARKLGVVTRVAAQQAKRSRMVRATIQRCGYNGALIRAGAASVVAGGYRACFLDHGPQFRGRHGERVREVSGRASWGRTRGGCNLLHSDVRVVWGEFVLEGEAEGKGQGTMTLVDSRCGSARQRPDRPGPPDSRGRLSPLELRWRLVRKRA